MGQGRRCHCTWTGLFLCSLLLAKVFHCGGLMTVMTTANSISQGRWQWCHLRLMASVNHMVLICSASMTSYMCCHPTNVPGHPSGPTCDLCSLSQVPAWSATRACMEQTRLARPWATSTMTAASPVEPAVSIPGLGWCCSKLCSKLFGLNIFLV